MPCAPSVAACDGRLARQPEHFVAAELDAGRTRQEKRGGSSLDGLGYVRFKRIELQIELSRDSGQSDIATKTR